MKLIEYKRIQNPTGLDRLGECPLQEARINHVYEGSLRLVEQITIGSHFQVVKKADIQAFINGNEAIQTFSHKLKENYSLNGYALSHSIGSHANGLVIDELKNLLNQFSDEEYAILSVRSTGEFFAYTDFVEEVDYVVKTEVQNDILITSMHFLNPEMKKDFTYELTHPISIADVQNEIDKLKLSEDVLFVHRNKGVGYAARNMSLLTTVSGFIYQNYLIEE